jgi:hypothetical protein
VNPQPRKATGPSVRAPRPETSVTKSSMKKRQPESTDLASPNTDDAHPLAQMWLRLRLKAERYIRQGIATEHARHVLRLVGQREAR